MWKLLIMPCSGHGDGILSAHDDSLPKICLCRLLDLASNFYRGCELNWATQFREDLVLTNRLDLWESRDPRIWLNRAYEVFRRYKLILRWAHLDRWRESVSCQVRLPRDLEGDGPERFEAQSPRWKNRCLVATRKPVLV